MTITTSVPRLYAFTTTVGVSYGFSFGLSPVLVRELFGLRDLAKLQSLNCV